MAGAAAAAARQVLEDHGLAVERTEVLHVGANVVLALHPHPVVARVAAATALVRPDPVAPLSRELALCHCSTTRGAPVAGPSPLVAPRVHVRRGMALGCWERLDLVDRPVAPHEAAAALAALHDALAGCASHADHALPGPEELLGDAVRAMAVTAYDRETERALAQATDLAGDVAAASPVPLHGDAHGGNVLATRRGARWIDLEDAWSGPLEWDLAVLARSRRWLDGAAAVEAYCAETGFRPDRDLLAACDRVRAVQAAAWPPLLDGVRTGALVPPPVAGSASGH